jgi:hypothetical protein
MRKTIVLLAAVGCTAVVGVSARAAFQVPSPQPPDILTPAAANDADRVFAYCMSVLEDLQKGRAYRGKRGPSGMGPTDCTALLGIIPAEGGQPGRGGDGGGFLWAPGGKGGASGSVAQGQRSAAATADSALVNYCMDLLRSARRQMQGLSASAVRNPRGYGPDDCSDYFETLDESAASGSGAGAGRTGTQAQPGQPGSSVLGGKGGAGGKRGSGPGGGGGGGGGAGVGGGQGGAGGAGGDSR